MKWQPGIDPNLKVMFPCKQVNRTKMSICANSASSSSQMSAYQH